MGDLLLVDFASRSKAYTKQPETLPTCHDDLVGANVLEAMADLQGIPYVAPESDGA